MWCGCNWDNDRCLKRLGIDVRDCSKKLQQHDDKEGIHDM